MFRKLISKLDGGRVRLDKQVRRIRDRNDQLNAYKKRLYLHYIGRSMVSQDKLEKLRKKVLDFLDVQIRMFDCKDILASTIDVIRRGFAHLKFHNKLDISLMSEYEAYTRVTLKLLEDFSAFSAEILACLQQEYDDIEEGNLDGFTRWFNEERKAYKSMETLLKITRRRYAALHSTLANMDTRIKKSDAAKVGGAGTLNEIKATQFLGILTNAATSGKKIEDQLDTVEFIRANMAFAFNQNLWHPDYNRREFISGIEEVVLHFLR